MSDLSTPEVPLDDELAELILEHVRSDVDNEVGGVLVGRLVDGTAEIREVLPALEAVGGAAQLTFTHEVWEDVLSTVDREHPDLQIVGWYHSHPGHGIFLSSYDQFIHENFFSAPGMVALVVDPRDDDAFGWFGWRDGELTRLGSDLPVDRPDRAEVPREVAASSAAEEAADRRAEQIREAAIIFLAVLLVFALGTWFGKRPLRAENEQLRADLRSVDDRTERFETALLAVCRGFERALFEGMVGAAQLAPPSPAETPADGAATPPGDNPTATPTDGATEEPPQQPAATDPVTTAVAICEQVLPSPPPIPARPTPSPSPTPAAPDPTTPPPTPTTEENTP